MNGTHKTPRPAAPFSGNADEREESRRVAEAANRLTDAELLDDGVGLADGVVGIGDIVTPRRPVSEPVGPRAPAAQDRARLARAASAAICQPATDAPGKSESTSGDRSGTGVPAAGPPIRSRSFLKSNEVPNS